MGIARTRLRGARLRSHQPRSPRCHDRARSSRSPVLVRIRRRARANAHAAHAHRQHDADRVRLRQQHLDRRARAAASARRLTSFQGQTRIRNSRPTASSIAFSARYAGNADVYVVPAEGGEPKRLTWHPGADVVQGWTPDGKSIVFTSSRATCGAERRAALLDGAGRRRRRRRRCRCRARYQGKISPDGKRVAYRMNNSWDEERRNYRGGQNRPIWIVDLKTFDLETPPVTTISSSRRRAPRGTSHFGRQSDRRTWIRSGSATTSYFISDRDGVANVWALRHQVEEAHAAHEVHRLRREGARRGGDGSVVVFEQAGYIHVLDPKTGKEHVVNITATGDFPWMMPQWKDVTRAA